MSRTVLVADDNLTVQRMASEMLSEEGMDVITVANGMAAIKKLSDVKPLVVVADVDMPGKNGYEVCDFVKSQPELGYVRVLLVVSDSDPLDGGRGAEVRADGIIKKPFDRREFVSMVVKSLDEAQALCPPPAVPEPLAAAAPPDRQSEQSEPWAGETIEPTQIFEINEPNKPYGPASLAPNPASPAHEPPELETAAEFAHEAPLEVHDEIVSLPDIMPVGPAGPEFTPLDSLEPPVVDWPASPMATRAIMASFAGEPPEPANPNAEHPETELAEFSLPDLAAMPADSAEELGLEPMPLPDLMRSDIPEAYLPEEHRITALPDDLPGPAAHRAEDFPMVSPTQPDGPDGINEQAEPAPPAELPDLLHGDLGAAAPAIDPLLVAAVIHAVVARMAPPALPRESVESLERQLADEIMPELMAKL
ncbi:MAG: response regulator [Terriglobia bacterium]